MRRAARVLVVDGGRVLAVRDWSRPDRIGIPGGGVERGEAASDAARRELWEETGLRVKEMCYLGTFVDEGVRVTEVYCAAVYGTLRPSHEGEALWTSPETLLTGRYGDFHAAVFRLAGV